MKMCEIIIKNQKEWDELDKNFKEPTNVVFQDALIDKLIERYYNCNIILTGSSRIGSMYASSSVGSMCDSSSVGSMCDSSIGSMRDSSSVGSMYASSRIGHMGGSSRVGYMCASSKVGSMCDSSSVGYMRDSSRVEKAFDGAVIYTDDSNRVGFFDTGITVKRTDIQSSFETMLEHGILRADGITKVIKKVKQITESEKVYFLEDGTFCVQNGDTFAHAKTLKMSLFDLRFKLSDRDMSDYENLSTDDKLSLEDAITCYRAITGACSGGVEDFLERESMNKNEFTIGEIIELTKDAYAGDTFAKFFKGE